MAAEMPVNARVEVGPVEAALVYVTLGKPVTRGGRKRLGLLACELPPDGNTLNLQDEFCEPQMK